MSEESSEGQEVRSYFVRGRNALLTRADFADLYIDYYLKLAEINLRHTLKVDQMLKDAAAALALHCASKPWNEATAWTIHFQDPLANFFVTGNNAESTLIGNAFQEDVKDTGKNLFFSDMVRGTDPVQRSVIEFGGGDLFDAVEAFYTQSEQRLTRFFHHSEEDIVMITAQPDCDLDWLAGLDDEAVQKLDTTEELSLLETRHYNWQCGCTHDKILAAIAPAARNDIDELFEKDETIRVRCPRCGARHVVTRESIEAFLAANA